MKNVKCMKGKERQNSKKSFLVSLMAVLLISSLAVGMFAGQAMGQSTVHVGTEAELRAAVSNAASGVSTIIVFDRDIGLTGSALTIPADKDITLRSNGNADFSLFGASGASTITVANNGKLTLAGIIVTHVSGASGNGVRVDYGGTLFMSGGKISGNSVFEGGGVYNGGTFTMTGGEISNNEYYGVFNIGGTFTMSGGKISNNNYGVYVYYSTFTMNSGRISDNTNYGVLINSGTFTMTGGEISKNGGGVSNYGTFTMSNGVITENTAGVTSGGGVRNGGTFTMTGGEISKNDVVGIYGGGGGVWTGGTFTMNGGEISKNTAAIGGGVYVDDGNFNLYGGKISGNTATRNGGAIWVTDTVTNFNRLTVRDGVVFSDNRASAAYNRDPTHDSIYRAYIEDNVVWSSPFTQGYNNFDISYVYGTSITTFTVTANDAYGTPTGAGSYSAGATVTLNAGTRNGYTFLRWTVNEGGVTLPYNAGVTTTFTMPTNNVVVTASWTAVQYSITYALNGGSAAGNPTTYNAGNLPIAINNPTRAGYDFTGWTVRYANNTEFTGQTGYSIPAGSYGNVVFTANWGTPSAGSSGGSGSGGSGGSSGGSSSGGSSGGSGSNNSGGGDSNSNTPDNANNPDNNTPYNGNNGSHGSDDNRQQATNNELSTVRVAGALGVTLFFMLLIIVALRTVVAFFERSVKRKVAEIDENKLELPKRAAGTPVCWSAVSIKKLNIMLKRVFGDEYTQLKPIKTKTANVILTLCTLPAIFILVFIFVFGILLNPAVYTSIFNLDFAALGTVFAEGLSAIWMFDVDLLFWVFMAPLLGFIIYCLIMLHNTYWGILGTRDQIHVLVKYYNIHTYDYKYSCGVSVFSSGDIIDNNALMLLIECHNKQSEYDNRAEYTENTGYYRQQEDEGRENEEYENQTARQEEPNPFEVMGVSENATEKEVKAAWQTLSAEYHPDTFHKKGKKVKDWATEEFKKIEQAYDQIKKMKGWA